MTSVYKKIPVPKQDEIPEQEEEGMAFKMKVSVTTATQRVRNVPSRYKAMTQDVDDKQGTVGYR